MKKPPLITAFFFGLQLVMQTKITEIVKRLFYISSTERYQQDDLERLHKTIHIYHPFS
jgi:hypothetical protein